MLIVDTRGYTRFGEPEDDPDAEEVFQANATEEEQRTIAVVVCISRHPLRGEPSAARIWQHRSCDIRECSIDVWYDADAWGGEVDSYMGVSAQGIRYLGLTCRQSGVQRDADTLPVVKLLLTGPPATMADVLDTGVIKNRRAGGQFQAWIAIGDMGHVGEGNALQVVDRVAALKALDVTVACHERLTVVGSNIHIQVARRRSLETVMLVSVSHRDADTLTSQGDGVAFLPSIQTGSSGERTRPAWREAADFLRAWPDGEVPYHFTAMPEGEPLSRGVYGGRVVAALSLLRRARAMAGRTADTRAEDPLTSREFEVAWQWLQGEFAKIWEENEPEQVWQGGRERRKRTRGALRTWCRAVYGHTAVVTTLLRNGFRIGQGGADTPASGADTPASTLGRAMRAQLAAAQEFARAAAEPDLELEQRRAYREARRLSRAVQDGTTRIADLSAAQQDVLQRLRMGDLPCPPARTVSHRGIEACLARMVQDAGR